MSEQTDTPSPPENFVEQVKLALEHLYDFAYLQRSPLAQQLAEAEPNRQTASHLLRRELITAVEMLSPAPYTPPETPDGRIYNLLQLRYIEGVTVQEAANRLGLSTRQAHRSLRRGEESVATLLWDRLPKPTAVAPSAQQLSSVQAEMAHLETHMAPADLRPLLNEAYTAVAPLADSLQVPLSLQLPPEPLILSVDTAVTRQIFVSLFSRLLKVASRIDVSLSQSNGHSLLTVLYQPQLAATPLLVDELLAQLIERLGWNVRQETAVDGRGSLSLTMNSNGALILVIDDNEGLVELLDRYLTGHHCRVVTATSGPLGLQLAQELLPDAIILDVMMPGKSGWEILQTLRSQPATSHLPIIVCSVFNDPDLAYTLGASRFLPKPISRDNILNALHDLGVVS